MKGIAVAGVSGDGTDDSANIEAGARSEDLETTTTDLSELQALLARARERLSFYEGFDRIIAENVRRSGELMLESLRVRDKLNTDANFLGAEERSRILRRLNGLDGALNTMRANLDDVERQVSDLRESLTHVAGNDELPDIETTPGAGSGPDDIDHATLMAMVADEPADERGGVQAADVSGSAVESAGVGVPTTADPQPMSAQPVHEEAPVASEAPIPQAAPATPAVTQPAPAPAGAVPTPVASAPVTAESVPVAPVTVAAGTVPAEPVASAPPPAPVASTPAAAPVGPAPSTLEPVPSTPVSVPAAAPAPPVEEPTIEATPEPPLAAGVAVAERETWTEQRTIEVIAHEVTRAALALALQGHLRSLPQVAMVDAREFASGMLRLQVAATSSLTSADLTGWSGSDQMEIVQLQPTVIELRFNS